MIKLSRICRFFDGYSVILHKIMCKKVVFLVWILLGLVLSTEGAAKNFTLVIDAGHGGKDAGALGSFSKEKNVALSVALAFGRYVERYCPDVKVIYTRKTDVFVTLEGRANIANRNKADLFVSIHCNALPNRKIARGMETYTLGMHRAQDNLDVAKRENEVILYESNYKQRYAGFDPRSSESYIMFELLQDNNMQQSVEMARLVQRKVCSSMGRPDKGVRQAGFLVLRETSMPSCLIELGFITTPDEERMLNDPMKQEAMGYGIYQAFLAYKKSGGAAPSKTASVKAEPEKPVAAEKEVTEKPAPEKVEAEQPVAEQPEAEKNTVEEPVAEKAVEQKPVKEQSVTQKPVTEKPAVEKPVKAEPVFKVQILANDVRLKANSPMLKGRKDAECYEENKMFKYTVGASTDYNEINRLRATLAEQFPGAFVIAFKEGKKMDVKVAIQEFKNNRAQKKK